MLAAFAEAARGARPRRLPSRGRAQRRLPPRRAAHARRPPAAHLEGRRAPSSTATSRTTPTSPTGCSQLYQTTFDERWFVGRARARRPRCSSTSPTPDGGFFDTSDDHEAAARPSAQRAGQRPAVRRRDGALVLLQLAAYTGEDRYRDAAEAALARLRSLLLAAPTGFAQWLIALDFATSPVDEVALVAGAPLGPEATRGASAAAGSGADRRPRCAPRRRLRRLPAAPGRRGRAPRRAAGHPVARGTRAARRAHDRLCLPRLRLPAARDRRRRPRRTARPEMKSATTPAHAPRRLRALHLRQT